MAAAIVCSAHALVSVPVKTRLLPRRAPPQVKAIVGSLYRPRREVLQRSTVSDDKEVDGGDYSTPGVLPLELEDELSDSFMR